MTLLQENFTKVLFIAPGAGFFILGDKMGQKINLEGKKFNRLIVIKELKRDKWGQVIWLCQCDCGKTTQVTGSGLRNGGTKSCGCWNIEALSLRKKHGLSKTGAYRSWKHMMNRCYNPNDQRYEYYGGRGIKVCKKWHNFMKFYKDMGDKPDTYTIERKNNNGNYDPSNCEWVTVAEQNRNNRRTRKIEYKGVIRCMSEWARILNIHKNTLKYRLDNHSVDVAFNM